MALEIKQNNYRASRETLMIEGSYTQSDESVNYWGTFSLALASLPVSFYLLALFLQAMSKSEWHIDQIRYLPGIVMEVILPKLNCNLKDTFSGTNIIIKNMMNEPTTKKNLNILCVIQVLSFIVHFCIGWLTFAMTVICISVIYFGLESIIHIMTILKLERAAKLICQREHQYFLAFQLPNPPRACQQLLTNGNFFTNMTSTCADIACFRKNWPKNQQQLYGICENHAQFHKDTRGIKIAGSATAIAGTVLGIVGFGLSFVTFGASLGLSVAGGVLAGSGGIANFARDAHTRKKDKKTISSVQTYQRSLLHAQEIVTQYICGLLARNAENNDASKNVDSDVSFLHRLRIKKRPTNLNDDVATINRSLAGTVGVGNATVRTVDLVDDVAGGLAFIAKNPAAKNGLSVAGKALGGIGVAFAVIGVALDVHTIVTNGKLLHSKKDPPTVEDIKKAITTLDDTFKEKTNEGILCALISDAFDSLYVPPV